MSEPQKPDHRSDHDGFEQDGFEQEKMDRLLRQSMRAVPSPVLSPNFDGRLAKRLRPRRLSSAGRIAIIIYAFLSLALSVWLMRSNAFSWVVIAIAILVPVTFVAALQPRQRRLHS